MLACRIASLGTWLTYDGEKNRFSVPSMGEDDDDVFSPSRVSTFALIATSGTFDRTGTWESQEDGKISDVEKDMSSPSTEHATEFDPYD
jgi:hypothetical protein